MTFKPFSDDEAEKFIDHVGCFREQVGDTLMLKALTGYNPLILSSLRNHDKSKWRSIVYTTVRLFASQLLDDLNDTRFATLVKCELPYNTELLYCALNRIQLPSSSRVKYETSWVAIESIVYVVEGKSDENFTLAMNFPPIYDLLMEEMSMRATEVDVSSPIIDGYRFEAHVCSTIKTLEFSFSDETGSTGVCKLPVKVHISQEPSDLYVDLYILLIQEMMEYTAHARNSLI